MCRRRIGVGLVFCVVFLCSGRRDAAAESVRFVDDDSPPGGDGLTWVTAYRYLQDAIAEAAAEPTISEIRVGQGVYKPDQDESGAIVPGDRSATFQLLDGVSLLGGYAGLAAPDPDARDIDLYETILSGDLGGNDGPGPFQNNGENSIHVVTGSGTDATAVLDGFTVRQGNADSGPVRLGAGFYNVAGSPSIERCTFRWNSAMHWGGALYTEDGSPTLSHCEFDRNITDSSQGRGGALYIVGGSPIVSYCIFARNRALDLGRGGAVYNDQSSATISNCVFVDNYVNNRGGGVYNIGSDNAILADCVFVGNYGEVGGAVANHTSDLSLVRCTFERNSAAFGGAISNDFSNTMVVSCGFYANVAMGGHGGAIHNQNPSSPSFENCVFSGNKALQHGGAMWLSGVSPGMFVNCTLVENIAGGNGGGIYNTFVGNAPVVTNCIFWRNAHGGAMSMDSAAQIFGGTPVVTFSCVQDENPDDADIPFGGAANSNIDDDPDFVDIDGPDNQIGSEDDNVRLIAGSPCLDIGDNGAAGEPVDFDGNPRIADGTIDLGAFEGPNQAFLIKPERLTVPEGGAADFYVRLAMDPQGPVLVGVQAQEGDPDIVVQSGAELIFDSNNYFIPQTVTVSAAKDTDLLDGSRLVWVTAEDVWTAGVTALEKDADAVPSRVFVDESAPPGGSGTSWSDPLNHLQDALTLATEHAEVDEIWVAAGRYTPDLGLGRTPGDRTSSFRLLNGVRILGGFAGASSLEYPGGETEVGQRNVEEHETILSGDLVGDDLPDFVNSEENSLHVVIGSGTEASAVLEGFTVCGGNADGYEPDGAGGGMFTIDGMATVRESTFESNRARSRGAGIANLSGGNVTMIDCTFRGNVVFPPSNSSGRGGGMSNDSSKPVITGCVFEGNIADFGAGMSNNAESSPAISFSSFIQNVADNIGGGMHNVNDSAPLVTDSLFSENSAPSGGGISSFASRIKLIECTFTENTAGGGGGVQIARDHGSSVSGCTFVGNAAFHGGGLSIAAESNPMVSNCLFVQNVASGPGAFRTGGGIDISLSSPTVEGCTFVDNFCSQQGGGLSNSYGDPTIVNCLFLGNSCGTLGGGMDNFFGNPRLTNCAFSGNTANNRGGGFHNGLGSEPALINCTFSGNGATNWGGGVFNLSSIDLHNCILWDNTDVDGANADEFAQLRDASGAVSQVLFSCIQDDDPNDSNIPFGGLANSNIDDDPLFVDADGRDGMIGTDDDNLRLLAGSPCIDAGDNGVVSVQTDLAGNPRIVNGIVDMGAYEFQPRLTPGVAGTIRLSKRSPPPAFPVFSEAPIKNTQGKAREGPAPRLLVARPRHGSPARRADGDFAPMQNASRHPAADHRRPRPPFWRPAIDYRPGGCRWSDVSTFLFAVFSRTFAVFRGPPVFAVAART